MSTQPELTGDERLAAELALGVLEGEALAAARKRNQADPAFAAAVRDWEERLAPLLEDIVEVTPSPGLWQRIRESIAAPASPPGNVIELRRRVKTWQAYSAGITALAACLALAFGLEIMTEPDRLPDPGSGAVMVATLESDQGPTKVVAAWQPETQSLVVTPALLTAAAGHNHELWLIPEGGQPRSLGLVRTDAAQIVPVPADWTKHVGAAATLAVTVEPVGGSPTGKPTGPVIAAGHLQQL